MKDPMLRELRMVSYAHLTAHIQLLHKEWSENPTEPFVDYASEMLINQNNISKQPIIHHCLAQRIERAHRLVSPTFVFMQ